MHLITAANFDYFSNQLIETNNQLQSINQIDTK